MTETIATALRSLESGEATAVGLIDRALAAADTGDDALGVFLHRADERARAGAEIADRRRRAGTARPLEGVPIAIKDIIVVDGMPTTAQSDVLEPSWAGTVGEAPAVTRLTDAGAIVVGKTTTMEFAAGMPDPEKHFPLPRNPWDPGRYAGGSSSGSASGLAAGMFLGSLGTDTGGSIRMPAAFCGVAGLRPTHGLVPTSGVFPLSPSLDTVGPMARTAEDVAIMLDIIGGAPTDERSTSSEGAGYQAALSGDLSGLRIGVDDLDRFAADGVSDGQREAFQEAIVHLVDAGAEVVPVALPMFVEAVTSTVIIMLSDGLAIHRNDLRRRWSDFGLGTRIGLAAADAFSGADYARALHARSVLQDAMASLYSSVDIVLTPTGHGVAPATELLSGLNPLSVPASMHTPYWSSVGCPVLAVPIGLADSGLPVSASIAGRWWDERTVLRVGDALQRRVGLLSPPANATEVAAS